jgi:hypothetical protein
MNTHSELAKRAAGFVMAGAVQYLDAHGLTADPAALAACCRSWAAAKLPEALSDARDAFACHMEQPAVATFALSMMQAGIEAAKEVGRPAPVNLGVSR